MATRIVPFSPVLPDFPSSPAPPPGHDAIIISDPHVPLHASGSSGSESQFREPVPRPPADRSAGGNPSRPAWNNGDASGQVTELRPSPSNGPVTDLDETDAILSALKPVGGARSETKNGSDSAAAANRQKGKQDLQTKSTVKKLKTARKVGRVEPIWKTVCRAIAENKFFVGFTTLLTVYALVGDDIRLLATNKPADNYFNVLTLITLVVFLFEIFVSCLGKSDYFLGFFFVLDVISTATLLLDVTWVSEILLDGGDGQVDSLRSGRTARIGAKAGRVVRVIRLVRIIKLWKAIQDAKHEKKKRRAEEGDDDWGEDDPNGSKARLENNVSESRVGKKLSEMTTRRVIILVLTMLMALPFLQSDPSSQPPQSPWFAADDVLEAYTEWNSTRQQSAQKRYERAMLKYLYYFNWFSGNVELWAPEDSMSPRGFQSHVFWVGVMSSKPEIVQRPVWAETTHLSSETIEEYEKDVLSRSHSPPQGDIYVYGSMPSQARTIMSKPWRYIAPDDCPYPAKSNVFRYGFSLLNDEIDGLVSYAVPCPESLRFTEKTKFFPRITTEVSYKEWHFAFYFDQRPLTRQESFLSLCTTAFICMVLCVASLYFSNDANRLVLRPVENMVKRVEMIRNDPLIAVKMADEEFKLEEKAKDKLAAQRNKKGVQAVMAQAKQGLSCFIGQTREPMETVILEKTIIKLGSLLALGFGEAGANIIGHNLESSDSAGVNAMIEGQRVEAIIGLARIRDFSTATEVLKAKVMTFVNQIAEIVHGVVAEFHGAANRNNGDTFLLVWRITGLNEAMVSRMADMSAIAFAKILGSVHRSMTLADYRGHPALQQRLGRNCRVQVTMGLHCGWAIEGAVGSEFKIDASYLSPNVSIAVQVEQATNTYNVPILITEQVTKLCCPELAIKCRKIDRVVIRGSSEPTCLFCLDLDYLNLEVDYDMNSRPQNWNSRWRFKARQFLEAEKTRKLDLEVKTVTLFDNDKVITQMRLKYSIEFLQQFNMGFQNYMEGEWQVASKFLTETRGMLHFEDGPSTALLRFMEIQDFTPPSHWVGLHELVLL